MNGATRTSSRPPTDRAGLAAPATTILLALTLPLWLESPYFLHVVIMAGIFGVLALSLNLLLGYTGQLSLGHAAFFGIGAYASALLTLRLEWSFWLALPGAVALAALAGWLIGRLALKLRGAYFVLVTISFAGVVALVSVNWMELTNGPLGLPGVPAPTLGPWSLRGKRAYYYLVFAAVLLAYLVCRRLVGSRIGRAFVALRENEALAESVGVNVTHYLVLAAVVSAAMAGLAGSLYAHYTRFVSPEVFLFSYTVTMVIMVVAGGKGTLTSVIGPNGAGKTTAFNAITGYLAPTRGRIEYDGGPLTGLRPSAVAARGIVRTFQRTSVFPALTVADNVMTGLHLRGAAGFLDVVLGRRRLAAEESRLSRDADGIIDFVGLGHRRAERASELPYGEQRLVELAVALGARPRLLLLDEPGAGMTTAEKAAVP